MTLYGTGCFRHQPTPPGKPITTRLCREGNGIGLPPSPGRNRESKTGLRSVSLVESPRGLDLKDATQMAAHLSGYFSGV